jgi:hypothetical protein
MKRICLAVLSLTLLAAPLALLAAFVASPQANAESQPAAQQQPAQQQAAQQQGAQPRVDAAALRAQGPEALTPLLAELDAIMAKLASPAAEAEFESLMAEKQRIEALIDAVGGARYCSASRFYWYADLEQAKAAAAKSGKPILSLRMMGRLTDEYSCANSRFFRTTLYANEGISQYVRDNFVLHWKSVRPVPKVTIDFGDGRKLERTLTGNSAHYILDTDGQPLDVLPGLYSPQKFLAELQQSHRLFENIVSEKNIRGSREQLLRAYHEDHLRNTIAQWKRDLAQVTVGAQPTSSPRSLPEFTVPVAPGVKPIAIPAPDAAWIAEPKGRIEMPIIREIVKEGPRLEAQTDAAMWEQIAALHAGEWKLDDASVNLIRGENPTAAQAGRLARTKAIVEDPVLKMVRNLESSIALDTVRNEYQLRRQVHQWYIEARPTDVELLNERVYAELFLTPSSDPWIGLVPDDTYTGLENGGVVSSRGVGE